MTRAVVLGGSRWWLAAAAAVALALFATTAFGQDGSLVAQGERVFNDQGCYGCHVILHVLVGAPLFSEGPFTMKHTREVFEAARAWVEKMLGGWVAIAAASGLQARWIVCTGVPLTVRETG